MMVDSNTNQQFPIVPNDKLNELKQKYTYSVWEKVDDNHTAIRFCTSWAAKKENVEKLIDDIAKL